MNPINQKEFLGDLQALAAIQSTRDDAAAREGAPFGPGPRAALDKMLELGQRDGFRTKVLQGYAGYIEYGPEDAEDYIAVLGHVDVVPATGHWTHDPFTVHLENGTLHGRGVIDDKGPTLAAYYALKRLKESGVSIRHRIRLVIGTDEESGCECMEHYNQVEPMSLFGFAPDAEFPLIFAEKGRIEVRIEFPKATEPAAVSLKQFYSGERANMVPDHAFAILGGAGAAEASKQAQAFLTRNQIVFSAENGGSDRKLTVKGQSAHGSEPSQGINAAFLLAAALQDLPFAAEEQQFLAFLADTLQADFAGARLDIACSDSISGELTVNAGVIRCESGKGGSVVLDVRCPVRIDPEQIAEKLMKKLHAVGLTAAIQDLSKPLYVDPQHPGVQILKRVFEEKTGRKNVQLLTSGGGTYAQYLRAGVAFGACMPGYPYTGHQVDEHIRLDDLLLAVDIYTNAMEKLGNLEK